MQKNVILCHDLVQSGYKYFCPFVAYCFNCVLIGIVKYHCSFETINCLKYTFNFDNLWEITVDAIYTFTPV